MHISAEILHYNTVVGIPEGNSEYVYMSPFLRKALSEESVYESENEDVQGNTNEISGRIVPRQFYEYWSSIITE
ncbi:MAG: hypothetical protein LBJ20_05635 [Candidatus Methanoplasma sp.]|nr:hypothetical protein [Candidatus Methanoplasma sp.]